MTKIIGLTGGIGSGKSTIAEFFKEFGIPVYIADDQAKKLMQSSEILESIKNVFGNGIFENEILNRAKLADIVFNDSNELSKLNEIAARHSSQAAQPAAAVRRRYFPAPVIRAGLPAAD